MSVRRNCFWVDAAAAFLEFVLNSWQCWTLHAGIESVFVLVNGFWSVNATQKCAEDVQDEMEKGASKKVVSDEIKIQILSSESEVLIPNENISWNQARRDCFLIEYSNA